MRTLEDWTAHGIAIMLAVVMLAVVGCDALLDDGSEAHLEKLAGFTVPDEFAHLNLDFVEPNQFHCGRLDNKIERYPGTDEDMIADILSGPHHPELRLLVAQQPPMTRDRIAEITGACLVILAPLSGETIP